MNNKEKYDNIFIETFGVEAEVLESLEYNSIPQWDSVGHMGLMAALEETFGIMMDMEEIINFNSHQKGLEIIEKHNVNFEE